MNLKQFEKQVAVSTENICREIFLNRSASVKIKKEKVAVKNLARIFEATLKLANHKGFHAMSLRELCAESGELQTEAIFSDILDRGIRSGTFSMPNAQLVAAAIKALLQDWYLKRWKYHRRKISVDTYADFILSMIKTYCGGANEGSKT